jgi:hypothetical protein
MEYRGKCLALCRSHFFPSRFRFITTIKRTFKYDAPTYTAARIWQDSSVVLELGTAYLWDCPRPGTVASAVLFPISRVYADRSRRMYFYI